MTVNIDGIFYKKLTFIDDSVFYNCSINKVAASGGQLIGSTFVSCIFNEVNLYWCMAFKSCFVNCKFQNCDLRGNFDQAKFIDCHFSGCQVGDNALGGKTEWENAVQINCNVNGSPLPIV
jgi:uncharacterized protein YjbI with pentapeptide repeats